MIILLDNIDSIQCSLHSCTGYGTAVSKFPFLLSLQECSGTMLDRICWHFEFNSTLFSCDSKLTSFSLLFQIKSPNYLSPNIQRTKHFFLFFFFFNFSYKYINYHYVHYPCVILWNYRCIRRSCETAAHDGRVQGNPRH